MKKQHAIYRNNLKNREFGEEAPQNFQAKAVPSERPLPNRQGAREHENFEEKPTLPKTNSSGCSGIVLWIIAGMLSITPLSAPAHELKDLPWLTGPLIAPPGFVVPKGHYSVQTFLSFIANTGTYNSHWHSVSVPNFYNVTIEVETLIGITPWMDFQTIPQALYNHTQGHSSAHFGDLPMGFDFQLLSTTKYRWFPGIKLQVLETFPTGHYQKLNPKKLKTDASGLGSFYTSINLIFYKVYHLCKLHYMSMIASLGYSVFAPVHVKGFNVYGGGFGTRGKIYPGNAFSAI